MKIIAICGFIGSGKDTLASLIPNSIKLSFASTLKDIVAIVFSWDRKLLEGDTSESRLWREQVDEWWSNRLNISNLTPRWILQNWGTEVLRNHFHSDIWIACIENKINHLIKNNNDKIIVITDCRFENEIECLKKLNTKFIHIQRGNNPEWIDDYINKSIIPKNVHSSEYLWVNTKFDMVIENNGPLEHLSIIVKAL